MTGVHPSGSVVAHERSSVVHRASTVASALPSTPGLGPGSGDVGSLELASPTICSPQAMREEPTTSARRLRFRIAYNGPRRISNGERLGSKPRAPGSSRPRLPSPSQRASPGWASGQRSEGPPPGCPATSRRRGSELARTRPDRRPATRASTSSQRGGSRRGRCRRRSCGTRSSCRPRGARRTSST